MTAATGATPRDFFETMVKPPYQAWLADPLTEWKAKAAVQAADILAERVFVFWHARDASKIHGASSVRKYREHLRDNVCPDFGLVWDIHDGHKHVEITRKGRSVSTATQTGVGRLGFGQGRFGEGTFGGGDQMVVELDDGTKRAVSAVIANVMAMWETELQRMGL